MNELIRGKSTFLERSEISDELKLAFLLQAERLLKQGETVWHSDLNNPMILFEGRPGEDFVGMQSQTGGNLDQLGVVAIEGNVGYCLLYDHYINPELETSPKEMDSFQVGFVMSSQKKECRFDPKYKFVIESPRIPTARDFSNLVALLGRTNVDHVMQKRVVDGFVRTRNFKRKNNTERSLTTSGNGLLKKLRDKLPR